MRRTVFLAPIGVAVALSGCTSAQLATAKSDLHVAAQDVQAAISAYEANQGSIDDVLAKAQGLVGKSGTLAQAVADLQVAAVAAKANTGSLDQVKTAAARVAALTVPPAAPPK